MLSTILLLLTDPAIDVADLKTILTLRDMTVGGVLVSFCIYLGYRIRHLEKKIAELEQTNKQLWEQYVTDVKTHAADFKEEANKFHLSVEQFKEVVQILMNNGIIPTKKS